MIGVEQSFTAKGLKDFCVERNEFFDPEKDDKIRKYNAIESLIGTRYYVGMEYKDGVITDIEAKRSDTEIKITIEKICDNKREWGRYAEACMKDNETPLPYPRMKIYDHIRRMDLAFMEKLK